MIFFNGYHQYLHQHDARRRRQSRGARDFARQPRRRLHDLRAHQRRLRQAAQRHRGRADHQRVRQAEGHGRRRQDGQRPPVGKKERGVRNY